METLTLRVAVGWNSIHADMLGPALKADKLATAASLQSLVESGRADLLEVIASDHIVGAVVVEVERRELGNEAVIRAAAGNLKGASLALSIMPAIERVYLGNGCKSVTFDTARPGLVRQMKKQGYKVATVRMVKHG